MDRRHAEYLEYYRARHARRAADPAYPESADAEAALLGAVESAATLEEAGVQTRDRGLDVACAVALLRDQAHREAATYTAMEEPVRARAAEQLLRLFPSSDPDGSSVTAADVVARAGAVRDENRRQVTADELHRCFESDIELLDQLEVWERADVPPSWRPDLDRWAAEGYQRGRELWTQTVLPEAQHHTPGWSFEEATVRQSRFRRRVPVDDSVFERRLEQYRRYRGAE